MRRSATLLAGLLALAAGARGAVAQCEVDELFAGDADGGENLGRSTSLYEDRLLAGAPFDDAAAPESGSAYVFERQGTAWVEVAKLVANDGAQGDLFGNAVSLHGDYALVGAERGDGVVANSGSAYVFQRMASGWVQVAKLAANDGIVGSLFGAAVALFGDTAVVGARSDDDLGNFSGSAYVFERQGTAWVQTAKLLPSDGVRSDEFGRSVAIFDDVVLVGATGYDDIFLLSGAVYVFERSPAGVWGPNETVQLQPSSPAYQEEFGLSVSLHQDTALIGARVVDSSGAAYVFERGASGDWNELARLTASDAAPFDVFGFYLSVFGTTALIGATGNDDLGDDTGSAYVFERRPCGAWGPHETAKLVPPDAAQGDRFGSGVSLYDGLAAAGARETDEPGLGPDSGSVYVFTPGVGTSYCPGQSGCPCGNPGAPGRGCSNSAGTGAVLCASGSSSACADDAVFHGRGLLPGQPALLFVGQQPINGGAGIAFGDGLRCAGMGAVRLGIAVPDAAGDASWGPGLGVTGGWGPGDRRYFQAWYRDPLGPCGSGFNLTNGLQVLFGL